jgi:hypothetical protein
MDGMKDTTKSLTITACTFCGAGIGKLISGCPDGERHCLLCTTPESRASNPCLPNCDHLWRRGHNFQRVAQ